MKLKDRSLAQTLWFMDYDGSLCPHVEVWEERQYDAEEIFQAVSYLNNKSLGALWNTGRRHVSLEGVHSSFMNFSGYFVQGSFFWDAKASIYRRLGPSLSAGVAEHFTQLLLNEDRFRLEVKETSLRIAPPNLRHLGNLKEWLVLQAKEATPEGWHWVMGHRGVELLAQRFDKATALRFEKQKRGDFIPVVVGDDVLDEPAAREALNMGGYVVLVGDTCGWITQVPHLAWQIVFCEKPSDVLDLISKL